VPGCLTDALNVATPTDAPAEVPPLDVSVTDQPVSPRSWVLAVLIVAAEPRGYGREVEEEHLGTGEVELMVLIREIA
jgi:hypothetical protein